MGVSVVGRFAEGSLSDKLTTTDGGAVVVLAESELAKEVNGASVHGFVEVTGTKEDGVTLRASTVVSLGEQMDVGLWDDAIKMAHLAPLQSLFEPAAVSVA